MTYDQFMMHVLNHQTSDYQLQRVLLEKRTENKFNSLEVHELCDKLNQGYERLCKVKQRMRVKENLLYFMSQLNEKVTGSQNKSKKESSDKKNDGGLQPLSFTYCKEAGHTTIATVALVCLK
jgi:hypothetical protein